MAAITEDRACSGLPNKAVSAADGIDYAYRDTGGQAGGTLPLVLFQHFRGNLDNWDPALIDALAAGRRVITFDYAGVGGSAIKHPGARVPVPAPPRVRRRRRGLPQRTPLVPEGCSTSRM
jgi:pimeloyl-ACP methyl ester carboxylesterase